MKTGLGWLAFGLGLAFVGGWAGMVRGLPDSHPDDALPWLFAGFLLSMIVCGASGVGLLVDPPVRVVDPGDNITLDRAMRDVKAKQQST